MFGAKTFLLALTFATANSALVGKILRGAVAAAQPNPPQWPASVHVFSPSTAPGDIEAAVNAAFSENGGHAPANHGQFSSSRYAFLFEPGTYSTDVPVGYYTQVLGLGDSPDDVVFTGPKGVYCEEGSYAIDGALSTFWRSAENFKTAATFTWATGTGMMWAVSQAAPLRRVDVVNELILFEYQPPIEAAGEASGGYMSDVRVGGKTTSGSQQQWLSRNSNFEGGWEGGVWNMVFVGNENAPQDHCSNTGGLPFVVVDETPTVAGKPFISLESGLYSLNIPQSRQNTVGAEWLDSGAVIKKVGFEQVYVASAEVDTAVSINAALSSGLHVVLAPGIYSLDASLQINTEGQVLLGLGLATLVAANGQPAVKVGDVNDVRVAGILLQAGAQATSALLQWGNGGFAGSASTPGVLSDVFARVGGPDTVEVQAEVMVEINSGNVIGDNLWLWRADHSVNGLVYNSYNPCTTGLKVTGDDVTMFSLAAEHTLGDLVSWSGNNGRTYFYQSEFPYDVTQANYGDKGFAGYRVGDDVTAHDAWGIGVYHYFRDNAVTVDSGIVCPAALETHFKSSVGVWLNGDGTMNHVINTSGNVTNEASGQVAYQC